jgi:hypothetical protein
MDAKLNSKTKKLQSFFAPFRARFSLKFANVLILHQNVIDFWILFCWHFVATSRFEKSIQLFIDIYLECL